MVSLRLLLVAAAVYLPLALAAAPPKPFIGGASTFKSLAADLIAGYAKKAGGTYAAYDAVGSGAGVTGFIAKTYAVAVSDDPMTKVQETQLAAIKITLPLTVTTFSFFTKSSASIVLPAVASFKIFSGAIKQWSAVPGANGKITGAIKPVARGDKSGSTSIVQQLWTLAAVGYRGPTGGESLTYAGLTYVTSTGDMCGNVSAIPGAIGYALTGGCKTQVTAKKISEVALKNKATVAVTSASWNVLGAFKGAVLPAPTESWAGKTFVWTAGQKAPPMVSMEYSFFRQNSKGVPQAAVGKAFLIYAAGAVNSMIAPYGFYAVPAAWVTASVAVLAKAKV